MNLNSKRKVDYALKENRSDPKIDLDVLSLSKLEKLVKRLMWIGVKHWEGTFDEELQFKLKKN